MDNYKNLGGNFSIGVITACLLFALGCQSVPTKSDARSEADIAIRSENLENSGKQDEALAELETGLRIFPKSATITRGIGRHYLLLSNFELAEQFLKKAQDLDPKNLNTLLLFGSLYFKSNQPQKALEFQLAAYDLLPEEVDLANHLGWGYWGVGNFEKASEFFSKYLKNGRDPAEKLRMAYFMQQKNMSIPHFRDDAAILLEKKLYQELEQRLEELKTGAKLDEEGDYLLTKAYDDMMCIQKKGSNTAEWSKNFPDSAFAKSVLGTVWIEQAWLSRGTGYGSTVTDVGKEKFKTDLAEARKQLQQAIEKDPSNPETMARLLRVSKGEGDPISKATEIYRKAISLDPNNFAAAKQMMNMFSPRWGGSTAGEITFARETAKTMGTKTKAPLLIVLAHWDLVETLAGSDARRYFSDPAVWKECKVALEETQKRFPNSVQVRSLHIQTAYSAGALDEARQQLKDAGDKFNLNYWINDRNSFLDVKRELL